MGCMRIAEIFHSIQGEGKLVGVPSAFVRVAGCNLRCTWCDTPYASWDAGSEGARERTPEEILAEILAMTGSPRHVVLTGGEPMMFKEIAALIALLKKAG